MVEAWERVRANDGAGGVDGQSIKDFEARLDANLYTVWNRMTSGSYFPPAVKAVEIPKSSGGTRTLGIPTVADRVAQTVTKMYLEPIVEPKFHDNSYGYRPRRSQHQALGVARERCFRYDWVLEIDIKGFFDNIDHDLMMGLVRQHTDEKWVLLYTERWLKADLKVPSGDLSTRERGTPQGSVLGPLLSNIYLHHAFDEWMQKNNPTAPFERFADDLIVHCHSFAEAVRLKGQITEQLKSWKLDINEKKTRIVYCKDSGRRGKHELTEFTFLGYTFRPRRSKNKNQGNIFTSFQPAVSEAAKCRLRGIVRSWVLQKHVGKSLPEIAEMINSQVRGWFNYYAKFYGSEMYSLYDYLNQRLIGWAIRKYKRLRKSTAAGRQLLDKIEIREPSLFAHWKWLLKRKLLREGAV